MGWLMDTLQEVPLSAVLRERVALVEQKYEAAIRENAELKKRVLTLEEETSALRSQIPSKQDAGGDDLGADTARVLAHLFRAEGDDCDVGAMARALNMAKGLMQYHLDHLDVAGLATCTGGNVNGDVYWGLTPKGRRYAVEHKLI
jgi:hypothetical protein